jgi:hypothetical protein
MITATMTQDLFTNFLQSNSDSVWRRYAPCPLCHGGQNIKCIFGSKCIFPRSNTDTESHEGFHQLRQLLIDTKEKKKRMEEEERVMRLSFYDYTKKCGIVFRDTLCYLKHKASFTPQCHARGYAHSVDEMLLPFEEPLIRKYFAFHLPGVFHLNQSVLRKESVVCGLCQVFDSFQCVVKIHLYHRTERTLQLPMAVLYCRSCRSMTHFSLYI